MPTTRADFTATERAVIDRCRTPYLAQRWLKSLPYNHELKGVDWRRSRRNVWAVQDALIRMPHRRLHMADRKYEYWHERYERYKRRFPDRKPAYYPNKRVWL